MSKSVKRGRGRPAVYKGNVVSHIVGLVRSHGATNARRILNAEVGSEDAALRSAKTVPAPLGISMPTILKMAKAAGVELKRGRPAGSGKVEKVAADAAPTTAVA